MRLVPIAKALDASIFNSMRRFSRDWPLTSAGTVIMIPRVLMIFLLLPRRFAEGLTQDRLN